MSIAERLQMVIKMNGLTNSSFADTIGVQRSSVSHVLSGRNKPSVDFLQKILETFPKVDANWLVSGRKVGRLADGATTGNVQEEVRTPVAEVKTMESTSNPQEGTEVVKEIDRIIVFYTDGTYDEMKKA